jgi:hypothetical protein
MDHAFVALDHRPIGPVDREAPNLLKVSALRDKVLVLLVRGGTKDALQLLVLDRPAHGCERTPQTACLLRSIAPARCPSRPCASPRTTRASERYRALRSCQTRAFSLRRRRVPGGGSADAESGPPGCPLQVRTDSRTRPGTRSKMRSFDTSGTRRRSAVAAIQRSASWSRWPSACPLRSQAARSSA